MERWSITLPSGTMRKTTPWLKPSRKSHSCPSARPIRSRNCAKGALSHRLTVDSDQAREFAILIQKLLLANQILSRGQGIQMGQRSASPGTIWWSQEGSWFRRQRATPHEWSRASLAHGPSGILVATRRGWHDWRRIKILARILIKKIKIKVFPRTVCQSNIQSKDRLDPRQKRLPSIKEVSSQIGMNSITYRTILKTRAEVTRPTLPTTDTRKILVMTICQIIIAAPPTLK